jgi:hypothetical protein
LWQRTIEEVLLARNLISAADLALYKITDSADEALAEIQRFYRVYHSMRYVNGDLVLRLNHRLDDALLEQLRLEFADIMAAETLVQTDALPEEANDTHVADLPRLRFRFDRKSLGRLRMLVDTINRDG